MKTWLRLCVAVILTGSLLPLYAEDFNPPAWRDLPNGSTMQHWKFTTETQVTPELFVNPYGTPTSYPYLPAPALAWLPTYQGRDGVWQIPQGNAMVFEIPTCDCTTPPYTMWVRIQFTYHGNKFDMVPNMEPSYVDSGYYEIGGGWWGLWIDYDVACEDPLLVGAFADINSVLPLYLDQTVIDVKCVPEPATLAGLGALLIGFIGLKRRK